MLHNVISTTQSEEEKTVEIIWKRKRKKEDQLRETKQNLLKVKKHTTPGIRWWSPTQLLIRPSPVYLGQSGRDAEFSDGYGRMCHSSILQ
jgi:hypothetical protein